MKKMLFDRCGGCCKGDDCSKKEGDKSGSFGSNQGKWQEKSDKKDAAKCNHGPHCHCGHNGCKECSK